MKRKTAQLVQGEIEPRKLGLWVAIGIILGTVFGAVLGNVGVSVAIGIVAGVAIGVVLGSRDLGFSMPPDDR